MIPASIRTNNPGAMYPGPSSKRFGSSRFEVLHSHDGTHKIACFDDPVDGAAAQFDLLSSPDYTGRSIRAAIQKWCGGYYANSYIKVLEEKGHVTAETLLTRDLLRNPQVAIPLAKAMAWQEAGIEFPLDDAGWRKAHEKVFGVTLMDTPAAIEAAHGESKTFSPTNALPSPKPETRIASMKAASRKWNIVVFVQRWFLKLPVVLGLSKEAVSASGVAMPDIPAIQENVNAAQNIVASLGNLGWIGWGLVLIVAFNMVQKFMVEDARDGNAVSHGA